MSAKPTTPAQRERAQRRRAGAERSKARRRTMRTSQPFEIPAELEHLMTDVAAVRPLEGNARRGDVEFIKDSLRKNGLYRAPVARTETGEILVNNHTVAAALELGATALPIDWRSVRDDNRARAIALVDNAAADRSKWDEQALRAMLDAQSQAAGTLDGTGFDTNFYEGLLERTTALPGAGPEPGELPTKPRSRKGQVYSLGPHRVLCGDATNPDQVRRLLGGEPVDVVWTDPPYGIDLGGKAASLESAGGPFAGVKKHGAMDADALDDDALEDLVSSALALAGEHAVAGAALYLCHADTKRLVAQRAMARAGWPYRQTLIWTKDHFAVGRQHYHWRHEPILYGWRAGRARWFGNYNKDTVIEGATRSALEELSHAELVDVAWRLLELAPGTTIALDRPRTAELHPTAKPTELVARCLRNSAPEGGIVYDPFAGSGTTLVAAAQTGRRALLMEIDPRYVDVVRKRWEELQRDRD